MVSKNGFFSLFSGFGQKMGFYVFMPEIAILGENVIYVRMVLVCENFLCFFGRLKF